MMRRVTNSLFGSSLEKPCPLCATEWVDQACLSTGIRLTGAARRQLIAGLLAHRHLILSGPSGVGKTRLSDALALCMVQGRTNCVRSIQGHPWWAAHTQDVARFVTMQTDHSVWRLADFVECIEWEQTSPAPAATDSDTQEHVALVYEMSPVEIELYFGRFLWWLNGRRQHGGSPIPLRLVGTYTTDSPPLLDDHILRLAALVHLGRADVIAQDEHD